MRAFALVHCLALIRSVLPCSDGHSARKLRLSFSRNSQVVCLSVAKDDNEDERRQRKERLARARARREKRERAKTDDDEEGGEKSGGRRERRDERDPSRRERLAKRRREKREMQAAEEKDAENKTNEGTYDTFSSDNGEDEEEKEKKRQAVDAVFEEYVTSRKPAVVDYFHGDEIYKPKFFERDQVNDRLGEQRQDEDFGGDDLPGAEGPSALTREGKEDEEGGSGLQADLELEMEGLFLSRRPFISKK